jgi:hypothetical protein
MALYKIIITQPIIEKWEYEVYSDTPEKALENVLKGDEIPIDFSIEEKDKNIEWDITEIID